ncbi:MAG: CRISPR-associated protein Cas4 [Candidatus Altiarchaeota archaeon]
MKVNVSSLNTLEYCPRVVYLRDALRLKPEPTEEMVRGLLGHAVRKELSIRQPRVLECAGDLSRVEERLMDELKTVLEDAPYIYREMLWDLNYAKFVDEIRAQVEGEISAMAFKLRTMVSQLGLAESVKQITPWRVEYTVRSDSLKLSGRVDKVMRHESIFPVEIKTGQPPQGVWSGDAIQVCAYAMLLEEKFNQKIDYGYVEYVRSQESKPVLASEKLRREVILARDSVLGILDGAVPEPIEDSGKCPACSYRQLCITL